MEYQKGKAKRKMKVGKKGNTVTTESTIGCVDFYAPMNMALDE